MRLRDFLEAFARAEEVRRAEEAEALRLRVRELELRREERDVSAAAPPSARGLTERQIRQAAHKLREQLDRKPTRAEVAAALHTTEPTLKRAMTDLRMGRWPPAPPED